MRLREAVGLTLNGRVLVTVMAGRTHQLFWRAARKHIEQFPKETHRLIATSGDPASRAFETWTPAVFEKFAISMVALHVAKFGGLPKEGPLPLYVDATDEFDWMVDTLHTIFEVASERNLPLESDTGKSDIPESTLNVDGWSNDWHKEYGQ